MLIPNPMGVELKTMSIFVKTPPKNQNDRRIDRYYLQMQAQTLAFDGWIKFS